MGGCMRGADVTYYDVPGAQGAGVAWFIPAYFFLGGVAGALVDPRRLCGPRP